MFVDGAAIDVNMRTLALSPLARLAPVLFILAHRWTHLLGGGEAELLVSPAPSKGARRHSCRPAGPVRQDVPNPGPLAGQPKLKASPTPGRQMTDILELVMRRDVLESVASLAALSVFIPLVWLALALDDPDRRTKAPNPVENPRSGRRIE